MGGGLGITLLEREDELATLTRVLDNAHRGDGGLAVVEGPAGIGKSSLLTAAVRVAGERGFTPLHARGSPLEEELSFGTALQLLEPAVRAVPEAEHERLFAGAAAIVRPMFQPAAGGVIEFSELDVSLRVLNGLYWLVADLAERGALVLCLDDAHWADAASLRLLHYLSQRLSGLPVAILIAIRSGESRTASAFLAELVAHPSAEVLALEPLSDAAVASVVDAALPAAEAVFHQSCAQLTAGNPFYVQALLTAVADEAIPPTAAGVRSLRRLGHRAIGRSVLSRLGRMPAAQRALARAATIVADGAPLRHVAILGKLEPAEAAQAADSLVKANVLERSDPVGFVHPLVREAVHADLSATERRRGHRRAARLLHAEHAAPEAVATHLLAAEEGNESWVVDALWTAAERVRSRGDPAAAATYLQRALSESGGLERRGEILFQLGLLKAMQGHSKATELIADAVGEIPDPNQRAFALMNLARILGIRGRYGESARAFEQASAVLDGTGSELTWWAEAGYAMSGSLDPATRSEASPLLEQFLEDPGMDALETLPIGRSALAFAALERVNQARPADDAIELALRVTSQELGDIEENGVAYRIAATVLAICGEFGESERIAAAMLAAAQRQGSAVEIAAAAYPRLHLLLQRGRPGEVIREAMTAIDGLRLGWGVAVPATHVALAWGHLERGERGEADEALRLPGGDGRWRGDHSLAFVEEARGTMRLAHGDAAGALAVLLRAGEQLDAFGLVNPALSPIPWRAGAAIAAASVGESARARTLAREQLSLAERFGVARAIGAALRTRGLVEGGSEGVEWLARSLEVLEETAYELELARSLVELGAALRRSGARRDAREPLRRGADLARRCGALALAQRGHDELRATGARPRKIALSGVEALTPSERRVADLAASGLTNRQIAEQLFLSKKTVEAHLGAVYRKLDVDRSGLAWALDPSAADARLAPIRG